MQFYCLADSNQKKGSALVVAIGDSCTSGCGSATGCTIHTAFPEKGKVKGSAKEKSGVVTCKASAKFTLDSTTNALSPALTNQPRNYSESEEDGSQSGWNDLL